MMNKIIYVITALLFFSCTSAPVHKKPENVSRKVEFSLPPIPPVIIDSTAQRRYLAKHYWDNYDFKYTTFIRSKQGENVFADYIGLLLKLPVDISTEDIRSLMQRSEADSTVCMNMFSLAEKNLYDPNSPLKNETLYMAVLEKILSWKKLNNAYKIRLRYQYRLAQKNLPGRKSMDFTYTLAGGKQGRLYGIKSKYILLYFNNPGCGDSNRVESLLAGSPAIDRLIAGVRLTVLSIYPNKDISEWKGSRNSIPSLWMNAYDKGTMIKANGLYDLRAIPTLYLLDKNKRVLLKDARFEELENYLERYCCCSY
jgi:hypothetical protein